MADRDVTVDVILGDKTGKGAKSAADNFDKLNQSANRSTRQVEQLAKRLSTLEVDPIDLNVDPRQALAQINRVEAQLREVSRNTTTARVRIESEKALGDLAKLRKQIGDVGDDAGSGFGKNFLQGFAPAVGPMGPILAGVAVASAPFIGATIAGAVIGGAGVGGVVGGLAIAAKDVRVQAAANSLGDRLQARLEKAGGSFVEPAIAGLKEIEQAIDAIDLEGISRKSSSFVAPLSEGISRAIKRLGEGFESLIENAGPVIDAIAKGFGDLGDATADVFESLSDNGTEAALAVNQAFKLLEGAIRAVGVTVNALTETYGFLARTGVLGDDLQREWYRLDAAAKNAEASTNGAADGIQNAGDAADKAAPPVKSVAEKFAEAADAAHDLFDSTTDVQGALDKATTAAKENGKTLSAHTEKGRDNRDALSGVAKALRENYERYVEVNGAGMAAAGVAEANRAAFVKSARQFGRTAAEANKLADEILGIPTKRDTRADFDAAGAKASIRSYKASIASIPRSRRTTVEIAAIVTGSNLGKSALNSALRKQSLKLDAVGTFAEIDSAGGFRSRTGGPVPISVDSNVTVLLDGQPFRSVVATAVSDSERRQAWRQRVGKR